MNKNIVYGTIISGGDITIGDGHNNQNHMTPRQTIQNLVASNKIDDAMQLLYQIPGIDNNDVVLLEGRWNRLKKDEMLGTLSFSEASQQRARITKTILDYAGCDDSAMIHKKPVLQEITAAHSSNWESALLQIIKDNDRKNQADAKKALALLESFRSYYDLKKTRAFFDRSGEKLQEIETAFDGFKKSLSKSGNESVEKFIDKVAGLIDAVIPDWPSIADAYALCVGRGMNDLYIERNLRATPNDDDAKLSAVQRIETFLGQL
jgi:hypothetical protein